MRRKSIGQIQLSAATSTQKALANVSAERDALRAENEKLKESVSYYKKEAVAVERLRLKREASLQDRIAAAEKRIAELEDANRWLKWPEEAATMNKVYAVRTEKGGMVFTRFDGRGWYGLTKKVTHFRDITPPTE